VSTQRPERRCIILAVAITSIAFPAGAQDIADRYTPEEWVALYVQEREAYDGTLSTSAGWVFNPCPESTEWSNTAFELMTSRSLGAWGRDEFARSLSIARPRCDDPRLDRWFADELRETSEPGGPRTSTLWIDAAARYPPELLLQEEFASLFWERAVDETLELWLRDLAVRWLLRGRPPAERFGILLHFVEEERVTPNVLRGIQSLSREWTDGFVESVAGLVDSRPHWAVLVRFVHAAALPPAGRERSPEFRVNPQASARILEAFLAAGRDPSPDWPEEAPALLLSLADRVR